MRRREFIALLGGSAAAWPLCGEAPNATDLVEGRSFTFDYRRRDRFPHSDFRFSSRLRYSMRELFTRRDKGQHFSNSFAAGVTVAL